MRSSWIRLGPKSNASVLMRKDTHRGRGEGHVKVEAEATGML